jgi:hypothetical protein
MLKLLRLVIGLKPTSAFVLGRPIPPGLRRATPIVVKHDRRISAGIFTEPPRKKGGDRIFRLSVWKSYQTKRGEWVVSTSFFPDEIDPALRLLSECRQALPAS